MTRMATVTVLGVAIAAAAILIPICYLSERNSMVKVLSGPERAYVVVGLKAEGNWMSLVGVVVCSVGGYFAPSSCWNKTLRDDLLVFEISQEEIASHRLENFGSTGSTYIFDGVLHYGGGVQATIGQQNGDGLVTISRGWTERLRSGCGKLINTSRIYFRARGGRNESTGMSIPLSTVARIQSCQSGTRA